MPVAIIVFKDCVYRGGNMDSIQIEAEPKDVGLDAERLTRIERHFESYVDDGRLAGWLVAVSPAREGGLPCDLREARRRVRAAD